MDQISALGYEPQSGELGGMAKSPQLYQSFIAAAEYSGLLSSGKVPECRAIRPPFFLPS
jgi:hypothetical protein